MNTHCVAVYFRTAIFFVCVFILLQAISLRGFAAEEPAENMIPVVNQAESILNDPDSTPPLEKHEIPPMEQPMEPAVVDSGAPPAVSGSSTIRTTDMIFNPPDLTPEKALYQIRFCVVFFVYGIIPLYTAIFLIWQFFKWVYWLIVRSV